MGGRTDFCIWCGAAFEFAFEEGTGGGELMGEFWGCDVWSAEDGDLEGCC